MTDSQINMLLNVVGILLGGGALGIVLRYINRRAEIHNQDEANIRDHYAGELKALREKLDSQEEHFRAMEKHWREMLEASDRRHQECEEARQALRREIDKMHAELTGLKRQISEYSADKMIELVERSCPAQDAPHSVAAAKRVKGDK